MAATYSAFDWYATPRYYDIIFDEDTRLEATFLEYALAEYGRTRGKRVLEPACGSGRLLVELAKRGYRVTGFDASEAMVEFSRERLRAAGQKGRLACERMESFEPRGPYDLAHCLVSTFKYLLTERDARAHLERVAAALAPGGVYVLGVHLTDYSDAGKSRERWVGRRGKTQVTCNIQGWPADRRRRLEHVRSRLVVEERGGVRRYETEWEFRTYDAAQLRRLLRSVPALEHVATYDFSYEPNAARELNDDQLDCVLVLRRRG